MKIQIIICAALFLGAAMALSGPEPAYSCGVGDYGSMDHRGMGQGQMGYGQMGPGHMSHSSGGTDGGEVYAPCFSPGPLAQPAARPREPQQMAPAAPAPGSVHEHQH